MLIRNTLAVIDYNSNIQRAQKVSKDGQGLFKKKVNWCCFRMLLIIDNVTIYQVDRTGNKATVVQQKVNKDRSYQENILDLCVQCLDTGEVLDPKVLDIVILTSFHINTLFQYPIDEEVLQTRKHYFNKVMRLVKFYYPTVWFLLG